MRRLVHIIYLLPALFALAFSRAPVAASAQDSDKQRAQQLWEQAVAAKGGRERLYAVRNLVISSWGKYRHGRKTFQIHTEAFYVFPNKIWSWNDLRPDVFGLTVEMSNFDTGIHYFSNSDNPPPQPYAIPGYETNVSAMCGLLGYLPEVKWLKPEILGFSVGRIEGRDVDVIHTLVADEAPGFLPADHQIDLALDTETHLPVRVSFKGKTSTTKEDLSDYVDVDGIKFPQTITYDDGMRYKQNFRLNVEYDESVFIKPPLISAGPEAWKKK